MTDSGTLESPILKFFSQSEQELIKEKFNGPVPGTIFFVADTNRKVVYDSLGNLRVHLANELNLIDKTRYCFLWVENFPLFEWSDTENRIVACHHPFTAPAEEYLPMLNAEVADIREYTKIKARAYDIILNGIELGGGSIRIHNPKLQEKIFRILQLDEKEINGRFGFLIKALQFGAPPHGGIALGLDRVMALLLEEDSIREVIAFPKTQKGSCPLTNGPDYVSPKQLKELNIVTINK